MFKIRNLNSMKKKKLNRRVLQAKIKGENLKYGDQTQCGSEGGVRDNRYATRPVCRKTGSPSSSSLSVTRTRASHAAVTFSATYRTTLESSWTTRSIHLRLGSFSREICFFTIASKAMSGVNRPTLMPGREEKHSSNLLTFSRIF